MGLYNKAIDALYKFKADGTLPAKEEREEISKQMDAYGEELQDDIDNAQSILDKMADYEQAIYKSEKDLEGK